MKIVIDSANSDLFNGNHSNKNMSENFNLAESDENFQTP